MPNSFSPAAISQYRAGVPESLDSAVKTAMNVSAADRFQTAGEMVVALDRAAADAGNPNARLSGQIRARRTRHVLVALGATIGIGVIAVACALGLSGHDETLSAIISSAPT